MERRHHKVDSAIATQQRAVGPRQPPQKHPQGANTPGAAARPHKEVAVEHHHTSCPQTEGYKHTKGDEP